MANQTKIAVDMSWLGPTGIGRVASEVINRCPENWEIVPIREGRRNAGIFTPLDLARKIARTRVDLFWSPGFMAPAWYGRTPVILTVHDLTHLHFYKFYHRTYYNTIIRPLLRNAERLITVSDFSKTELIAWSGVSENKVTRIYNGVGASFSPAGPKLSLGKPYILYVGNRRSYKNVLGLMQAFAHSGLGRRGFLLALTGSRDKECGQLERECELEGQVHYLGFVPEEELPVVYRGALALAFVSRYEGFGLPILEAMASGIPVLTSNISSMPEVSGGGALLVNPDDVKDMADGLLTVATDMGVREKLINKGVARAAEFSWEKTANQYWKIFADLCT